jgi:hypothetical protein
MYQYSLDSFVSYFFKSIDRAAQADNLTQRVLTLRSTLRIVMYTMVSRGLFVRHKLIFLSQLTFNLMKRGNLGDENMLNETQFQFLLRCVITFFFYTSIPCLLSVSTHASRIKHDTASATPILAILTSAHL